MRTGSTQASVLDPWWKRQAGLVLWAIGATGLVKSAALYLALIADCAYHPK
jgi:hypothetical protein